MAISSRNTRRGNPTEPASAQSAEPAPSPEPQPAPQATADDDGAAAFAGLKGDDPENATEKDTAKAALEKQLQQEKDARNEERFVWIVVCVMLIDVLWFRNSPNATLPIVVLVLQLILLLVLAKRMGIEEIVQLVDRVLENVGRGARGNG